MDNSVRDSAYLKVLFMIFSLYIGMFGCNENGRSYGTDGLDSDKISDTDTGLDSDTDTDSDTKTDSESDTDSDSNTDLDSDTDTDSDTKTDSDTDTEHPIRASKIGWNLGNSLDAPEGETTWGNPAVTRALLEAVADAGFEVVRIPVTWSLHMGGAPDYTIDATWMNRVAEVVGYALDAGLYTIINLHHDGADGYEGVEWITLNDGSGRITDANNRAVQDRFIKVWTQIASHFRNSDARLLFESMNEIHDGYGEPDPQYHTIINSLNQVFVDTVRASGGHNATRYLIIPGYNTNIDDTLEGFSLPVDTAVDRLILSVHYYDPYQYAIQASTNTWGADSPQSDSWAQEKWVRSQFDKLENAYIGNGIPVIIGEYGAVNQSGFKNYRRYYMEYVTKAAFDRNIVPVYWDNGSQKSGADAFGLFDRNSNGVLHPTVLQAMMRAVSKDYDLEDVEPP